MVENSRHYEQAAIPRQGGLRIRGRADALEEFDATISRHDHPRLLQLLEESFDEFAVDGFSWMKELKELGCSSEDIAEELIEKHRDGPWIFSDFEYLPTKPFSEGFHIAKCLHSNRPVSDIRESVSIAPTVSVQELNDSHIRQTIHYLCGIAGVRPSPTEKGTLQCGKVDFDHDRHIATASLKTSQGLKDLARIYERLEHAAGLLQEVGGCCDSFTVLTSDSVVVQLHRIDLKLISALRKACELPETVEVIPVCLFHLLPDYASWVRRVVADTSTEECPALILSLTAQFLSLALLSYAQAHEGPLQPCFLGMELKEILLVGNQECTSDQFNGAAIGASYVNLTCFGDMLQRPVLVFRCFNRFPGYPISIWAEDRKLSLSTSPEDLLDTWGPGDFITSSTDPTHIHAITIGGGSITCSDGVSERNRMLPPTLHWQYGLPGENAHRHPFKQDEKGLIGAIISTNENCQGNEIIQNAMRLGRFEEMGTSRSCWEVSERQIGFGLQGGQTPVTIFQFNQTWVKRQGVTKKARLLAQKSLFVTDLNSLFGIRVSACTGVAHRVRLRDLLADLLPTYVESLVSRPPHWAALCEKLRLVDNLHDGDIGQWLQLLTHDQQCTFERLVLDVLFLLRDTGVDQKAENFVLGLIQPQIPIQCLRVRCNRANIWTRIVADSEEIATFAYITTQCLEMDGVRCRNSAQRISPELLGTAVSCYQTESSSAALGKQPLTSWTLKNAETYLIGRATDPLLVRVVRPWDQQGPQLLVSASMIPMDILIRLHAKGRSGKLRRLRERRSPEQYAEDVVITKQCR